MNDICVIACGVLAVDLKHVARQLGLSVDLRFLPGGLHAEPDTLRKRLQETIDEVSAAQVYKRIVIGYGICGRGTVGLRARQAPLVIPRVHDCIALFLGSDARYRKEFARHPGTYYLSAGWVDEQGEAGPRRSLGSTGDTECDDGSFQMLTQNYGGENAEYIRDFLDSWKHNYTRAAFIDTGMGDGKKRYEDLAHRMASELGWTYERLEGAHDLLIKALTADVSDKDVLVVPPESVTTYDAIRRRLTASNVEAGPLTKDAGVETREAAPLPVPSRTGIGLGIDAGGTYTDAVLFDFDANCILDKAKALTTPWDYTLGIGEALSRLDEPLLSRAKLVSVSTTLATNAIVEGRGQKVGLLVMPPCGWRENLAFKHSPLAFVNGQLKIDGTELEAIDAEQVRAVARRMVDKEGVGGFAVGGYASHVNQAHELAIMDILVEETGLGVTCAHELSEDLNYRVRAETAALNARIIPCLQELLNRLGVALAAYKIDAPVMIVRSDGSMMNMTLAHERPLDTILSGPAASVAGAAWLSGLADALVTDIGGTTTDTALVRNGVVELCADGAMIGGWQTHIPALNLRTLGLGGDGHVRLEDDKIRFGPERVGPIAWLAACCAGAAETLSWLEQRVAAGGVNADDLVIYAAVGSANEHVLSDDEKRLMVLLEQRPRCMAETIEAMGKPHPMFVPWQGLVKRHIVQRCALTPTDALHAVGRVKLWDRAAAKSACRWYAKLMGREAETFAEMLLDEFERQLACELLKKQIDGHANLKDLEAQPAALALLERAFDGEVDGCQMRVELRRPVVGVGAPAGCFVPGAAKLLHTVAIVPEHADVANAVGAITGCVSFHRHVSISVDEQGIFRLGGVPDAPVFQKIEAATAYAESYLRQALSEMAGRAGAVEIEVRIRIDDSSARATDGQAVFVGRTIKGHASGQAGL